MQDGDAPCATRGYSQPLRYGMGCRPEATEAYVKGLEESLEVEQEELATCLHKCHGKQN